MQSAVRNYPERLSAEAENKNEPLCVSCSSGVRLFPRQSNHRLRMTQDRFLRNLKDI
jgi:hypothetical protein